MLDKGISVVRFLTYTRAAGRLLQQSGIPTDTLMRLLPEDRQAESLTDRPLQAANIALIEEGRLLHQKLVGEYLLEPDEEEFLLNAATEHRTMSDAIMYGEGDATTILRDQVSSFIPFLIDRIRNRTASVIDTAEAPAVVIPRRQIVSQGGQPAYAYSG
ncbi:MAG: hypothetical protein TR69_WS6001001545 [candidate division WS6 bacterium OLB20]|uniref:Uncharacterized protein n=1 Tax=candidate division WS6 bacterium OLB20 TaxID=1617426 RepID=A0A136LVS0_9BACT|nr:MAG: hypothetical protein TR69_WS6001001545 [candidate division WS6 bacterium OLB20]